MKKIKTVFKINRETDLAVDEVVGGNEWVPAGEGRATIKFDGTACMVRDGKLYRRYDRKLRPNFADMFRKGKITELEERMFKSMPEGWEPCEVAPDPKTGHWPGWMLVTDTPENVYALEAFGKGVFENGTYELVGPKINSVKYEMRDGKMDRRGSVINRYNLEGHELWMHGSKEVEVMDRSFDGICALLVDMNIEGLVFHHPDGRMAKVRRKDFGIEW